MANIKATVNTVYEKALEREQELQKSIAEMRTNLTQVVDSARWREDQLRGRSKGLRMHDKRPEARNEKLAAALPNVAWPLLRPVETL